MIPGHVYLRVKIRSLAEEQRIIRHERNRARKFKQTSLVNSLNNHRVLAVRPEIRASLAAYAVLRGKDLDPGLVKSEAEQKRIDGLIRKYGPPRPLRQAEAA